ncbi:sigma-70 family RNA polymerase sigma factor [Streptomyces sp. NPDC091377]|uniref:sigma-70 family RNA polymerase sigma factor n=1 Tax=Streptomyces sp. NPDC091377 TaxID=3365995 RepID=UPI003805398E
MDVQDDLARRFEEQRGRLRAVAHRMLGSPDEADDAVQETWLRLSRTGAEEVTNLPGWLTTVLSRVCLDLLRARAARREEPYEPPAPESSGAGNVPEEEAVLADSVGLALLVVLDRLTPAERVAFVLHDLFAMPFEEVSRVVDRSLPAAKKLASRARHKVRGGGNAVPGGGLDRRRRVVEAFLAAARGGDTAALLAVLAPEVVRHADPAVLPPGVPSELRGARAVAEGTLLLRDRSRFGAVALVDGAPGIVVAPGGRLLCVLRVVVDGERVASYEVIADARRLAAVEVRVLEGVM